MRAVGSLILAIGLVLGCGTISWGQTKAPTQPAPAGAASVTAETLKAGDILNKSNWQLAKGLLPPEILRHYQNGDYANKIVAWPLGHYNWDPEFKAASESNAGKYTVSPQGTVLSKATGKQPPLIYGFPFPNIDPKDPNAGVKILWNYYYQYWAEGSSHNVTLLVWVNPKGVDREAVQDVRFLYYDGQSPRFRIPNPENFASQFIAVATSPADLNGTASLTWRYRDPNKRDSNWVYVPALRRVRSVSPANRSDGFLGSDMSQDDGPFFDGKPEDFTWKYVGQQDILRLIDPLSFAKGGHEVWLSDGGGWRAIWPNIPAVGFQDPSWKGIAWAPVAAALARRPCWVIEGVPKDKYYLYGKIQLYIDRETYQGAWNRKFGWTGELLNTLQVLAFQRQKLTEPNGTHDWIWASNFAYQCAENVKANRATVAGLLPKGHNIPNDRLVHYDPSFFDATTLQRFGK